MKICNICGISKNLNDFRTVDGIYKLKRCKECESVRKRKWIKDNPERARRLSSKSRRGFYKRNKNKIIKYTNLYNYHRDNGLYRTYWSIIRRCKYRSQRCWKWYGGKGIIVEWSNYALFKKDMYTSYIEHLKQFGKKETTIDRVNPNKNYCLDNCRWATLQEQQDKSLHKL